MFLFSFLEYCSPLYRFCFSFTRDSLKMPPKKYVAKDSIQKKEDDNSLSAVIVADNYDFRYGPLTKGQGPWCLQKVCNVPIIDYTLDWILRTDIKKIVLLVSEKNVQYLEDVEERWRLHFESFLIVGCKNAMSVGDAVRELDGRSLIQSDFILLSNPASFTNETLHKQIERFRARRKENKNNVMTLVYALSDQENNPVIGVKKGSDQLAVYFKQDNPTKLDVDKPHFLEDVLVRRDIVDSGIAICSLNILAQFSDNFDFQQRDDVIREILVNEEILLQNIHIDILDVNEAACQITDYNSYIYVSTLLNDRWLYPLCPDKMFQEDSYAFAARSRNIYVALEKKQIGILSAKNSINVLGGSSVFGLNCKTDTAVYVANSTIGDNTSIGLATQIVDCIIGSNCVIGKGCKIVGSVLGDYVTIEDGQNIQEQTILSANVKYPKGLDRVPDGCALCMFEPDEDDEEAIRVEKMENGLFVWSLSDGCSLWSKSHRGGNGKGSRRGSRDDGHGDMETHSGDDTDEDDGVEVETNVSFYQEVLESMERINQLTFSDQQMHNLILEINSSKLAYNISMEDVAKFVFKAFLKLEPCKTIGGFKQLSTKWRLLFKNYYEPKRSQIQMLLAMEERYESSPSDFGPILPKMVHFMYNDIDILEEESILEWNDSLPENSPIRTLMKPIIDWLEEDDDSEEDSD